MSRAEVETAACLIAARLGVELGEARRFAARLDIAKPGRLAALAANCPPPSSPPSPGRRPAMTDPPAPLRRLTAEEEAAVARLLATPAPRLPPRQPPPTHEPALRLPDPRLWTPTARLRLRVRCTAHRTDGAPCRAWAIRGGRVCAAHGGRAPQVREAARRRLESAALTRYLYRRCLPLADASPAAWASSVLGSDMERMAWADLVLGRD